jgi:hypothetical protein
MPQEASEASEIREKAKCGQIRTLRTVGESYLVGFTKNFSAKSANARASGDKVPEFESARYQSQCPSDQRAALPAPNGALLFCGASGDGLLSWRVLRRRVAGSFGSCARSQSKHGCAETTSLCSDSLAFFPWCTRSPADDSKFLGAAK